MLLTTLALAASLQFDCPATIETRQQLLTPQQGWQAFTRDDGRQTTSAMRLSKAARARNAMGCPGSLGVAAGFMVG